MKFIYKYLIVSLFFFSSDFYPQKLQESNNLIKNTSADLDSKKGLLGIRLMKLTPDIIKEKSLKIDSGILVYGFGENSAAEKYGVKINDVIKSIDGKECKDNNDVVNYIFEKSAGDKVNLVIDRDGLIIEIPVILRAITIDESIELYKRYAFEKFDKGDYEGAILNCSKILELVPDNFTVLGMRAVSKINNSNFKEALMDLNYYINLKSTNENYLKILPQMYAERGFVNFKLKSEEDGYADIIKATSLGYNGSLIKDAMNLYSQSAQIKSDGGDYFGAIKDYNKILEFNPENYLILISRMYAKANISDYTGSIEDVNLYIKIKSTNKDYLEQLPRLYYFRGASYSQLDSIDKACDDYRMAVSMGLKGESLNKVNEKIKACREYELLAKEDRVYKSNSMSNNIKRTPALKITKPIVINCANFIDNPEKYIGRTIMMEVGYASGNNGLNGLRKMQYDDYEKLFSLNLGFTEENETYNTRVVDCGGGSTFYIRIPKSVHSKLPNIASSGYFKIGGVVKDSNTIIIIGGDR